MSTNQSNKDGRPATDAENRADTLAAAPEKDELQLKRERVADAGLAHASLNNGLPADDPVVAGEDGSPSKVGTGTEGDSVVDVQSVDNFDELKKVAEDEGVDTTGLKSKAEVREAIEAKRAES